MSSLYSFKICPSNGDFYVDPVATSDSSAYDRDSYLPSMPVADVISFCLYWPRLQPRNPWRANTDTTYRQPASTSGYSIQLTESRCISLTDTESLHTQIDSSTVQGTNFAPYQPLIDDDHQPPHPSSVIHGHFISGPDVPPAADPQFPQPTLQFPAMAIPARLCICGCGREAVPMQPYRRRSGTGRNMPRELILFRTIEDKCGIKVSDALAETYDTLRDRDSLPFEQSRRNQGVTVRFAWPGYRTMNGRVRTIDWSRHSRPTRLSKLAFVISTLVVRFIRERQGEPYSDGDFRWRVGANGIKADNLVLVALEKVSKGSWQPHFRLEAH